MASNDGSFDVSTRWVILAPFPVTQAVEDLARCIGLLRRKAGLEGDVPAIEDALGPAPDDSVSIIVLNGDKGSNEQGGYTWRAGQNRVEIYGDSRRGLCNGIYDFLASLGFRWPNPGQELPPPPNAGAKGTYALQSRGAYVRSDPSPENRRRLVVPPKTKDILALGRWAARNRVDALVFSLGDRKIEGRRAQTLQEHWGLIIERGGRDLSSLVPRRHFLFKRDLFRMEDGKRIKKHHFCPTSPQTIDLLRRRIAAFLERQDAKNSPAEEPKARRIYHLWPDEGAELLWCACPACRAFSPREQIRLAVNTAAAVIAEKDPQALISCRGEEEESSEQLPGGSEITLRPNVFRLSPDNLL